MIYYIADMHFGHKNAIRFDKRPFANVDEMDETLIANWNNCVTADDTVYVLGDMFWHKETESIDIIRRLNGHKHLIQGNHDRVHGLLRHEFESIDKMDEINDNGRHVVLCHFPIPFFNRQHYGSIMLHGHIHSGREDTLLNKWKDEMRSEGIPDNIFNIGCMQPYMNFTPRTLDEILASKTNI